MKRIFSHKTFKETPRRRGRFSRSSSRSRCSSRNSAYASDAELAEELSECVRDLVKEVKELVHRSRDPSPVLTRNPHGNQTGICQKIHNHFSFNVYLAINDSFLTDKVIHHLPQYQPQPQYQPPTVIQPIVQPPTMIQPQFAPQPIVQQMPQISQIPQMPFHGFQNLSNHQMGQINPYLPYQPTRLPHGGKQLKQKTPNRTQNLKFRSDDNGSKWSSPK